MAKGLYRIIASAVIAGGMLLSPGPPAGGIALSRGPEEAPGEDAVILEESLEIEIASETDATVRYLNRSQALTPQGVEECEEVAIRYSPWQKIERLDAHVVSPGGKLVKVKKKQLFDAAAFPSYTLYADSMVRIIHFPGLVPGATTQYSYEMRIRNLHYLPKYFALQEWSPARSKTLTVRVPASFPIRLSVKGADPEYHREERGGLITHRWQVRDVPAFKGEFDMPPSGDLIPDVSISPKKIVWGDHHLDAASWDGIARFYWELARDRMKPSPSVVQAVERLTSGLHDPAEKMRALLEFAQKDVNYVNISLDIGGWQPHSSDEILRHQYGDCKDKTTLAVAMLEAIGRVGFPAFIRTRDIRPLDRDDPMLAFNHAILAIPGVDGYTFFDPTDPLTPFGDLSWRDQGVPVLVVKGDGEADLVETPLFPPERNRIHRTVEAVVHPFGDLEGTYTIDAWGQRRVSLVSFLDRGGSDLKDGLVDLMSWLCPGAVLEEHEIVHPEGPDDPVKVTIQFRVPRFVTRAGDLQVVSPHLVRFSGLTDMAAYSRRRLPIFFPQLFSETSEVHLHLPPGRVPKSLPGESTLEGPGLSSTTRLELRHQGDHDVLVVRRSATVARRQILPEEYPQFRAFVSALAEEEAKGLTLVTAR